MAKAREQTNKLIERAEEQVAEMRSAGGQTNDLIAHAASQAQALLKNVEISLLNAEATAGIAHATRLSAEAANLNAKALINAERAWLLVEMKSLGHEMFTLSMKNWGRTPAKIIDVKHLEDFPINSGDFSPDYRYEQPTRFVYSKMVAPGETWEASDWVTSLPSVLPSETLDAVRSSRQRYFIYGVIEYEDVINTKEVHKTRFCYFYSPTLDKFINGGPPDFTACT